MKCVFLMLFLPSPYNFFFKVFVGYNEKNDDDQANGQSQLL